MRHVPVLVGTSLLLATQLASARECAYWSGNGPSVYGLQNGLTETYAGAVDQAGLGGLRLGFRIDTQTAWNQALFDAYDAYMAVAREHGLEVLGIVLYESTTEGQASWNSGFDATGMSPYVQAFVDTTRTLMDRYGDQVKSWEIWNEPNAWTNPSYATNPTQAGGTYILPQVYAKMLAEVFVQAHATIQSKGLHLVTGGLFAHDIGGSFSPATDYAQQVYANGVWDWLQANYGRRYPWDGFGYHVYIDQGGATSSAHILQYLDAIQQLKVQQSDDVPLWITEFGWQSPTPLTDAQQAANLDTALKTFESRGDVARTFVFKVDDYDDWGIFDTTWTAKPAVATYLAHDPGCTHGVTALLDGGADGDAADAAGASDASMAGHPGQDASGGKDAGAAPGPEGGPGGDSGADGEAASARGSGCACAVGDGGAPFSSLLLSSGLVAALALRRRRGE